MEGKYSKKTLFITTVFLGWFGVQHFYVGNIILGITYLLTGGLFGVGRLVDMVKLVNNTIINVPGNLIENDLNSKWIKCYIAAEVVAVLIPLIALIKYISSMLAEVLVLLKY